VLQDPQVHKAALALPGLQARKVTKDRRALLALRVHKAIKEVLE
jgi:hypothetical protein